MFTTSSSPDPHDESLHQRPNPLMLMTAPYRPVPAQCGLGRAVQGLCGLIVVAHSRLQFESLTFAELDAPLVEQIDVAENAFGECLVLVQCNQLTENRGCEFRPLNTALGLPSGSAAPYGEGPEHDSCSGPVATG